MNVVWLSGMPRSGTTWVSQFFAASPHVRVKFCPLFSYAFKNAMSAGDSADAWRDFFHKVYRTPDDYMDQRHLRDKGLVPEFSHSNPSPGTLLIKSNRFHNLTEPLLEKLPEIQFLTIVRDPVATILSWLSNPLEFPAHADPVDEWRTGRCRKTAEGEFWGFDDWKRVTSMHLSMLKKYPNRFFLHRYEQVAQTPQAAARKMFSQLNIEFTPEVSAFIERSQARHDSHPRSVFKSRDLNPGSSETLRPDIVASIHRDLGNTDLAAFLESRHA
jgi:hypothetical protein